MIAAASQPAESHPAMPAATAVVFAYHDVGVRCLKVLLGHGVRVLLVLTHEDDPKERVWFGSVAALNTCGFVLLKNFSPFSASATFW